jgi:15-cis-phytoene synthase
MPYDHVVSRAPNRPADAADEPGFRAAREICRRQAKEFYFASAFLPRAKRDAAHAVLAFCGMIREAIDVPDAEGSAGAWEMRHRLLGAVQSPAVAMTTLGSGAGACCSSHPLDQTLSLIRDRLDDVYEGRLDLPSPPSRSEAQHTLHAFSLAARRYQIPRQYFLDLAEGCRRDLLVSRYATWASLERHCHDVGGVVALIMSCVFGVTHSGAAEHALKVGIAMRLTRILRDLGPDHARGRLYLPLEDMAAFRYSERDLAGGVVNDNFRGLVRFEIARARRLYLEGAEGLCRVAGDGPRLSAATMVVWQSGILDAIERRGYDVFSRRAGLTTGQKARRLPLAWRLARRRPDARLPAVFPIPPDARVAAVG